ncbi:putative mannan endo-1,4-beta-mannosidase 9 [Musa acuminata AAA Group]|uniref:putative mannan endo-1,4-beta-mannosidase 9 n=1 Tax=Musa acuminata AAA Group TaxID=214697 RepID=UPI0031D0BF90
MMMKKKKTLCSVLLFVLLVFHGSAYSPSSFAKTRGTHFVIDDRPFYSNGFNSYWLMYTAADPAEKDKVSSALEQASTLGLRVIRTWAFSDGGYRPLQYSPGVYNENMFKALDFVISEAKKYGVHLILSLVNNWEGFGGKKKYVQWARDKGQSLGSEDDFFRNEVVKQFYKNHVNTVLARVNTITGVAYKDDPTVFAWELMNEPRCQSDLSGRTLQSWITEMAAHVKSTDRNHMVEVGMEGFYGESMPERKKYNPGYEVGTDFIANNRVPGIDFATIHAYPDQWVPGSNDDGQLAFLRSWIQSHIQDAGSILGKPLMVTEFGKSSRQAGYTVSKRDAFYATIYDAIYASAKAGGPCAGGLFWQMLAQGMDSFRDGYEIIFAESPSTTSIISRQSHRISSLGVPKALEEAAEMENKEP